MTELVYAGTWSNWGTRDMPAITEIETVMLDSRLIVVTTSGAHGALMSWEWQGDHMVLRDQLSIRGDSALPAPGGLELMLDDGVPLLLSYGGAARGIISYSFDSYDRLSPEGELGAGAVTLEAVLTMYTAQGTYVFGDIRGQEGLSRWTRAGNGRLTGQEEILVGLSGDGPDVPDMAHWSRGGRSSPMRPTACRRVTATAF